MKLIGLILIAFGLSALLGGPVLAAVFGTAIGLAGGIFGLVVGLIGGLFGIVVGIAGGLFGLGVGFAAILLTLGLPFLIAAALIYGLVKLVALS